MIALTAAMKPELELIRNSIESPVIEKWGGGEFICGRLCGRDVAAAGTGVGKVLAAAVTQRLIDCYSPEAIIMSGIGGAINPSFRKGDIVIGTDSIQHDFDSTHFGFLRGEIPYTGYRIVPSDPGLIRVAESWHEPVKKGRILTGDQFITGSGLPEYSYLRDELSGDIVEMEGAAAGLTALINGVPFLLIRTVSDKADGEVQGSFRKFLKKSASRSFDLIKHILENY